MLLAANKVSLFHNYRVCAGNPHTLWQPGARCCDSPVQTGLAWHLCPAPAVWPHCLWRQIWHPWPSSPACVEDAATTHRISVCAWSQGRRLLRCCRLQDWTHCLSALPGEISHSFFHTSLRSQPHDVTPLSLCLPRPLQAPRPQSQPPKAPPPQQFTSPTSILNIANPSVRYMKTLMNRKLARVPNTPYIRMEGRARKKRLFSTDSPQ